MPSKTSTLSELGIEVTHASAGQKTRRTAAVLDGVTDGEVGEFGVPTGFNNEPVDNRVDTHEVIFEKPWHRVAALLFASGRSSGQVAELVGKSTAMLSVLRTTPWFNKLVVSFINENGGKDLVESFKKAAVDAHALLVEVLSNEKAPLAIRTKVATDMVERVYGKATQRVEHGEIRSDDPVAEYERLRRENELLRSSEASAPGLS